MTTSGATPALRRTALWGLLAAKFVGAWGLTWDIQWHVTIGRDTFWIPPHIMIYSSVAVGVILSWGVLAHARLRGLASTRGFRLAAWGLAIVVLAAPIDDLWHRLFGIDVTLWSPPHLLGLFGSAVSTLGCLLIATEVYALGTWAGRAALVLAGGLLYGGIRVTLEPSWVVAYTHGSVFFHTYGILGALVLPLALVTAARVSRLRWAPALVIVVALMVGQAGQQIARAGFAILQPVSVLGEAIAREPTSQIALSHEIGAKNRAVLGSTWPLRLLFPLIPAVLMAAADPRRRPVTASVVYGAGLFAIYGWYLTRLPAYAPLVPAAGETALALALALACGALGGVSARWMSESLTRQGSTATSPAR